MRNLFRAFDEIFCPNEQKNIAHKQHISIKKLCKVNAAWSTQKVILGWAVDTVQQVRTLPLDHKEKLTSLLDSFTLGERKCACRHWHRLLGTLHITVLTIAVAAGMFFWIQHALKTANGRQISVSYPIHTYFLKCHQLSLLPRKLELHCAQATNIDLKTTQIQCCL